MPVRSLKDAILTIKDGAGSPAAIIVTLDNGDLAFTIHQPANIISDRGVLDHARKGNEQPMDASFSVQHSGIPAGNVTTGTVSLYEMLTKSGGASGYTSAEDNSDVWAVTLVFAVTDPAGASNETITIDRFIPEEVSYAEGDPSTIVSCSGRACITAPAIS